MRENCTYGSMRGRAFPTGRPALLYNKCVAIRLCGFYFNSLLNLFPFGFFKLLAKYFQMSARRTDKILVATFAHCLKRFL